jgi:hypothetical protein
VSRDYKSLSPLPHHEVETQPPYHAPNDGRHTNGRHDEVRNGLILWRSSFRSGVVRRRNIVSG